MVNLHEKKRGVITGPYLTVETVPTLDMEVFTKRNVLSIISSFYDPLVLISSYLVIFKIRTYTGTPFCLGTYSWP